MNILFCGDEQAEDGILIAVLSLLHVSKIPLHIYILTMWLPSTPRKFHPFSKQAADYLRLLLQKENPTNTLILLDCTTLFIKDPPLANLNTRFTPYALLRLYADQLPQLPKRLLYLDDDIIVRHLPLNFYRQKLHHIQLVGVLDFWGRFFFHNLHQPRIFDYLNSGVLLLNLPEIRRTNLFKKIRYQLQNKKMFLPDQAAINKLATEKRIAPRRYNEQYHLQKNTVIQHFTTTLRFWPYFRLLTVKPWEVHQVHSVLHLHEYDSLLNKYLKIKHNLKK